MQKFIFSLLISVQILSTEKAVSQLSDSGFNDMRWRMIGPHRAGRTIGASGVTGQPNVFYIGVNNGGVWKTTDYGRTWDPIFDQESTGSIGDVIVAPSNPNIIYVGSGEGVQRPDLSVGNGIYKSEDAGKTWKQLGLSDAQQIGGLSVHPKDENIVFVAALGHPYGANQERGIFRSKDGGKTWKHVLFIDENTGAVQVTVDPNNPEIVFADLWASRLAPWENGEWQGPNSGLYKSADGGDTWKKITNGLPTPAQGLGRIGFCFAPSLSSRMYATVDAGNYGGIYRSDDSGENWYRVSADGRHWSRGSDFAEVKVHPKNPDILFSANVVTWKSEDGGKTWTGIRGAPGGDDYHRIWINPENPDIMIFAIDQGAIITVNGGKTFSSWFNQPTAQFYHVSTDNAFPYNVYGGQQENGSVGIASRGNDGQITFREWHPVGVEEYGYVAADPLDPNIIYGGKITRYDKRTGQVQDISPESVRSGKYRFLRTAPVLFSPVDPKTLYFAGNVVFKTRNGGQDWEVISHDLSRSTWDIPENIGVYRNENLKQMNRRGVVYTLAPSPLDVDLIWAGTDDGLIHITHDGGKSWTNVTPPAITSWSKVSIIEASHFDRNTAFAAVNRIRLDDMRPHIFKTTDGGKSWNEIVNGLSNDPINSVKEDPQTQGLLFCGSERSVSVSFDHGDHWQSLKLNMPPTSIRDLVIKDDDLVVGTHGRSFWILDNITPLRQIASGNFKHETYLFEPQSAMRVRWNTNPDTPLPQEEPAGENPPEGAVIDYHLGSDVSGTVTLDILDSNGNQVRHYSSLDPPYAIPELNIPLYWIRPWQPLSASKGHHRFIWDLHHEPIRDEISFPMSAIYKNTAPAPTAPWVMPGKYLLKLTVSGKVYERSMQVIMDPRITTTTTDLRERYDLSMVAYMNHKAAHTALNSVDVYRNQLTGLPLKLQKNRSVITALAELSKHRELLQDVVWNWERLFGLTQESDTPVTTQLRQGINTYTGVSGEILKKWDQQKSAVIGPVNTLLKNK